MEAHAVDMDNNGYISILEMIEFLESVCDEITESQVHFPSDLWVSER